MSGGPGYHGWTHRPKRDGGTDPNPDPSVPYAFMSQESTRTVGSGDSYNIDAEIIDWGGTDRFFAPGNVDEFFAVFTDGNGKNGIRILQDGTYAVRAYAQVQGDSPANLIPPAIQLAVHACFSNTNFTGASGYFPQSLTPGWLAINYAGTEYASPFDFGTWVGGMFVLSLFDIGSTYEDCYTVSMSSDSGAHEWYWSDTSLEICRLGGAVTFL